MCIAVYKPDNLRLFDKTIKNCFDNNSDGAGFMYAENGKLHIHKGFFQLEEFMEAYRPHETKEAVLHFRIRTHGAMNTEMCHPIQVNEDLAFVHNGIISGLPIDLEKSDTAIFAELILKDLVGRFGKNIINDEVIQRLIRGFIGGSKLIFMDNEGNTTIINKSYGEESADGCWFSNNSWKIERKVYDKWDNHYPAKTDKHTKRKKEVIDESVCKVKAPERGRNNTVIFLPKNPPEGQVAWPKQPDVPVARKRTVWDPTTKEWAVEYTNNDKVIKVGTKVRVISEWRDWKVGDVGVVDAFGVSMTAYVSGLYPMEGVEEFIPLFCLAPMEDEIIIPEGVPLH